MSVQPLIVVCIDFSADTAATLGRAGLLAEHCGATLRLLHVVGSDDLQPLAGDSSLLPRFEERVVSSARQRLETLAGSISGQRQADVDVVVGDVRQRILAAARSADLLVLGPRGTNPLRNLFIGSTADRLLRASPCPVLVVKSAPADHYRSVVLPLDRPEDARQALEAAARWAPGATTAAVHAMRIPLESSMRLAGADDAAIERVRAYARRDAADRFAGLRPPIAAPDRWRLVLAEGDPTPVIVAQASTAGADLIVIGRQGRPPWEEFLLGSVTRRVLATAECDVLVVPHVAEPG